MLLRSKFLIPTLVQAPDNFYCPVLFPVSSDKQKNFLMEGFNFIIRYLKCALLRHRLVKELRGRHVKSIPVFVQV